MNLTEKKSFSCLLALKQVLLRPLSVAMNKFSNLANKYSLTGLILQDIESGNSPVISFVVPVTNHEIS